MQSIKNGEPTEDGQTHKRHDSLLMYFIVWLSDCAPADVDAHVNWESIVAMQVLNYMHLN